MCTVNPRPAPLALDRCRVNDCISPLRGSPHTSMPTTQTRRCRCPWWCRAAWRFRARSYRINRHPFRPYRYCRRPYGRRFVRCTVWPYTVPVCLPLQARRYGNRIRRRLPYKPSITETVCSPSRDQALSDCRPGPHQRLRLGQARLMAQVSASYNSISITCLVIEQILLRLQNLDAHHHPIHRPIHPVPSVLTEGPRETTALI